MTSSGENIGNSGSGNQQGGVVSQQIINEMTSKRNNISSVSWRSNNQRRLAKPSATMARIKYENARAA